MPAAEGKRLALAIWHKGTPHASTDWWRWSTARALINIKANQFPLPLKSTQHLVLGRIKLCWRRVQFLFPPCDGPASRAPVLVCACHSKLVSSLPPPPALAVRVFRDLPSQPQPAGRSVTVGCETQYSYSCSALITEDDACDFCNTTRTREFAASACRLRKTVDMVEFSGKQCGTTPTLADTDTQAPYI